MVERSLSMREVPGSMPGFSKSGHCYASQVSTLPDPILVHSSGWPSGLRRQTQDVEVFPEEGAFWSTNVGVGSNPTSDRAFSEYQKALQVPGVVAKLHRAGFEPAT